MFGARKAPGLAPNQGRIGQNGRVPHNETIVHAENKATLLEVINLFCRNVLKTARSAYRLPL